MADIVLERRHHVADPALGLVDAVDEKERRCASRLHRLQIGCGQQGALRRGRDADNCDIRGQQGIGREMQELDRPRRVDDLPPVAEMADPHDLSSPGPAAGCGSPSRAAMASTSVDLPVLAAPSTAMVRVM